MYNTYTYINIDDYITALPFSSSFGKHAIYWKTVWKSLYMLQLEGAVESQDMQKVLDNSPH